MVDLRSDTVTKPSPAMRRAMAEAEVGDDVFGDDPTVNRLQEVAANRMGKEAALYVPSGTMANQLAIRLHTQPGDEVVMEAGAHPYNFEAGAPAVLSGVLVRPVPSARGILDPDAVRAVFRPPNPHFAPVALVCCEDTSNRGGGSVWPIENLDGVAAVAHERGARAHLDGARLFNAAVKTGTDPARRARDFDTVSFCLSKGLGAPVGSLLCGPASLMDKARRFRKAFGGAMRQSGILAAAGLYALDRNVARLADDHRRARDLWEGLRGAGFDTAEPETNMVYVRVPDAPAFAARLKERGVLCVATGPDAIRLVTHLDVDDDGIERAIRAFGEARE